jgi:galactokinase
VSFVVLENARVLKARRAIEEKNFPWLGELLYESHVGLSQMYNVSCDELDWLVDYTFDIDQFCGARMMGGGFGGCTINLIKGTLSDYIISDISLKYKLKFGIEPEIIQISSHNGIIYVYKDSRFF